MAGFLRYFNALQGDVQSNWAADYVNLTSDVIGFLPANRGGVPIGTTSNQILMWDQTSARSKWVGGILGLAPCVVVMNTPITLSTAYIILDGYTLVDGDRVLLNGQTNAAENGVWIWDGVSQKFTQRSSDNLSLGQTTFILNGTNAGVTYELSSSSDNPIKPGISTIHFTALGAGTVTSVGLSAPSSFNVGNSPVNGTGTIRLLWNVTAGRILRGAGTNTNMVEVTLSPGQVLLGDSSSSATNTTISGAFTLSSIGVATLSNTAAVISLNSLVGNVAIAAGYGTTVSNAGQNISVNLTNTGVTAGNYGNAAGYPVITVAADGRLSNVTYQAVTIAANVSSLNGLTNAITLVDGTGTHVALAGQNISINLTNSGVTASQYGSNTSYPVVTFDQYGRATNSYNINLVAGSGITLTPTSSNITFVNAGVLMLAGLTGNISFANTNSVGVTVAGNTITFTASVIGPAGGDLAGTYPNPTVAKINTVSLGNTIATLNNKLVADGSAWQSIADPRYGIGPPSPSFGTNTSIYFDMTDPTNPQLYYKG